MKRTRILEYIRELRENYPDSPLVPQVVGDELTFALKKTVKGIPIKDISDADFEMLESIIEDLNTLTPGSETVLIPYEIMDELEPYISEYLDVYVSEELMEIKINAPIDSKFWGRLETKIGIPEKTTKKILEKEVVPKVKHLSEMANKIAGMLFDK